MYYTPHVYPNRDADSCVLKMGDIQLHEQATVLMKLCLPETRENQDNVLNVHLNYFDMKQISEKNIPAHLTVRRSSKDLICETTT